MAYTYAPPTAESPAEIAAIGHLRGWCHDGAVCPICAADLRTYAASRELDRIISG